MWTDRLFEPVHHPDGQDRREILRIPVLRRRFRAAADELPGRRDSRAARLPPRGTSLGKRRQHLRGDGTVHEQRLHRAAGSVPLGLRVVGHADRLVRGPPASSMKTWQIPSRCLMTGIRDSVMTRSMSPFPPAGDDDVDELVEAEQLADRPPVGRRDDLHRVGREARPRSSPARMHFGRSPGWNGSPRSRPAG